MGILLYFVYDDSPSQRRTRTLIDAAVAGKNYKFVRLRITFQLDSTQTAASPLPAVDQVVIHFDFNF